MSDERGHTNAVLEQIRQAADDGDLPDDLAEQYDFDEEGSDDE